MWYGVIEIGKVLGCSERYTGLEKNLKENQRDNKITQIHL